ISIQVLYHPGWHATINANPAEVYADGLGMMWLRPAEPGVANVDLDYDGGWELRICGWTGTLAIASAGWIVVLEQRRRGVRRRRQPPSWQRSRASPRLARSFRSWV